MPHREPGGPVRFRPVGHRDRLLARLHGGDDCREVLEDALETLEAATVLMAEQQETIEHLAGTNNRQARTIEEQVAVIARLVGTPTSSTATHALVLVGGTTRMDLAVDAGPQPVSLKYLDAAGNETAAPDGATVVFSSDDPAVLAVDGAALTATPVAIGTANVDATVTLADGSSLPTTPDAVNVVAGATVSAQVVVG